MNLKLAVIAVMMLGGCSQKESETTIIKTCDKELYEVWNSTSGDGKTYEGVGKYMEPEAFYLGRRCMNCGGLHNPKRLYRDAKGDFFTIGQSSESPKGKYQ